MYLQLNTRFNPFTYDEMVKPLLYYQEAYDKTEAAYDTLAQQTEMWRNIANRDKSPEAFAMYQRYSNDLANAADSFGQGMTSQNRRALIGLKRRYASDIQPIATAYARQTALADEQRKAELANPTMLWERRASDMSLDDFIKNPSMDYGRSVSGATLSAQVAAGASALAKEFRDNPKRMEQLVGGDFFEYVKQRGFSSKAVLAAIMNSKEASPILTNLVETAIDSTGIKGWADDATLSQAYNYARQGLWNAVGQDEAQLVQNWRAQENLQHSHAMARQAADHAFRAAEAEKDRKIYAPREIIDKNGNSTGTFYDPKLNMVVDKDGKILGDNDGSLQKIGTGRGSSGNVSANTIVDPARGTTIKDFSSATTKKEIEKNTGRRVVRLIANHKGTWQYGKPGEDFGKDSRRIIMDNNINLPKLDDKGNPVIESGRTVIGGFTESNVVTNGGHFTDYLDNNAKYEYVDANDFKELEEKDPTLYYTLMAAANESGNPEFEVYRVKNSSSLLFGSDDPGYSYAVVGKEK